MDADEHIEYQINRHPVGIVAIYLVTFTILLGIASGMFGVNMFSETISTVTSPASLYVIGVVLSLFVLSVGFLGAIIYNNNHLIITNHNLTQSLQNSVISRKVSQLSLAKVQDVTVVQDGALANLFKFGTIIVETAGEEANFSFKLASKPYIGAKEIIEAHEKFTKENGQQNDF